jgi:glycine dehydrogenase subunit 1
MRYLPHTPQTRQQMMDAIGIQEIDELFQDVPLQARQIKELDLPSHLHEFEVEQFFKRLSEQNIQAGNVPFFLGAGAYRHHIPASVDALIQRGEFLTSYTPYQPEIAQGTLQYLFEFQTQVCLLTGMDVANASMYDGATATVEAVMMAHRVTKRNHAIISGALHPHYRDVIHTYAKWADFSADYLELDLATEENLIARVNEQTSCVVVQYPDFVGRIHDFTALAGKCHAVGALLIVVVTEIVALGLLTPPGAMGADIVVGEGQSIGVGLNFGGPTVGLFAIKEAYLRQMPGRIVGQTVDEEGKRGWVLTLSTREQHIRREKATSNICTNAGLCALAFTIHLALLGEEGLKRLAKLNHSQAIKLYQALKTVPNIEIVNSTFFNEFLIKLPMDATAFVNQLAEHDILAGVPLSRLSPKHAPQYLLVAATETVTEHHIDRLIQATKEILP